MNQKDQVLNHFRKKKSITSWEAIQRYHITRLAAVIYDLTFDHDIVTIMEKGEGKRWARYVYMGKK